VNKKAMILRLVVFSAVAVCAAFCMSLPAFAAEGRTMQSMGVSRPLVMLTVLAALSMVPFVVMMSTSFV